MKWRRIFLIVVIAAGTIAIYKFALLASASAKVLGSGYAFDVWHGPVARSSTSIGNIPTDIYSGSRSHFPLLLVHGVNETGKNSPEVKPFAEALAGSGFRVVVPQFERLTRQNVTPEDIDDVASVFDSLQSEAAIACVSYGCGPALIAASRPEIRDRVRFVLTFGAYFDMTETLQFIITSPPSELAYSKWIYMKANLDLVRNENDEKSMKELFQSRNRDEFNARLEAIPLLKDRTERLSPSRYIDGIRARLIVVHLGSDPCVPSSESVRMVEAAKALHIPYSLTILGMYGHTRPVWPAFGIRSFLGFYIPQSWKFISVLDEILSYA
jgi:acetyl esterase/lipase